MEEHGVNKTLAAGIFIVLVIILTTPLFIRYPQPAFAQAPVLRVGFIENRTIFDVQSSIGDYTYRTLAADLTWVNGSSIDRLNFIANDTYTLNGETGRLAFNLTVKANDLSGNFYRFVGDFNITRFMYRNAFYVFMNITEHRIAFPGKITALTLESLPYRAGLDLMEGTQTW